MKNPAIRIYPVRGLSLKARAQAWWSLGFTLALALLFLVFERPALGSQDTNSISPTNQILPEVMDNREDLGTDEEPASTNQVNEGDNSIQPPAPGPDGRTRRLQRQRSRRGSYSQSNGTNSVNSTNISGPLDYAAFRLITERNIFDPNRRPHVAAAPPAKVLDSFTLVGTMTYGKGDFAFFDGNNSDYKKVLKPADTIAGYKVVSILPDAVKLAGDTNQIDLAVGSQLRRQEDGTWTQIAAATAYTPTPTSDSTSTTDSVPAGPDSEILKRLMQRREKENAQ